MEIETKGVHKTISMSPEEAQDSCRLGQGKQCCIFVVMGSNGFECAKKDAISATLQKMLDSGTTNAKGTGNWEGCFWYDSDR